MSLRVFVDLSHLKSELEMIAVGALIPESSAENMFRWCELNVRFH